MRKPDTITIALVGQPNCGKSTVFNTLTGARQHVANWPGVTVDKISGWYSHEGQRVEVIDLPGAYSLTSFSAEERVTAEFLTQHRTDLIVNVVDASNLRQGLTLTLQLLEMGLPLIINLNMMDLAEQQGLHLDLVALEKQLQTPIVATSMKKKHDGVKLKQAIAERVKNIDKHAAAPSIPIYQKFEPYLQDLEQQIAKYMHGDAPYSVRWAALKLAEGDQRIKEEFRATMDDADYLSLLRLTSPQRIADETGVAEQPSLHLAQCRNSFAAKLAKNYQLRPAHHKPTYTEKIDRVVCHPLLGPILLLAVMFLLYYCSIVFGYKVTEYTWPLLAKIRILAEKITPAPGFIEIPLIRAYLLWFVDSVNALLNYLPIFFILFALIAILEDSGYMPRMAFITDRILRRFGLHGQSVLPMVLGGVYVGGCAVPAIMSCKGIPDERSRLATILITPLLNCQAKVPLYILLINTYFSMHKGMVMFFISTIGLLMLLPVAKLLTMTVLKDRETAPFLLEMPTYNFPTIRGVFSKAWERVWLYLKKITTVVVAVASIIFVLLQFPGISQDRKTFYDQQQEQLLQSFKKAAGPAFTQEVTAENIMPLLLCWDSYRKAKTAAKGDAAVQAVETRFRQKYPSFYPYLRPDGDPAARKVNRALRRLDRERKMLLADIRRERLENSLLGRTGRSLEPISRWAGFDWQVNVALLSSLAAKESSVATLGALYEQTDSQDSLEERMASNQTNFTPLHALAVMLFMVLYPPCIATTVAIKVQTGSTRWMLFSMVYPITLGLIVAVLVFSGSQLLGLDGLQAMYSFYGPALIITLVSGLIKRSSKSALKSQPE